MMQKHQESFTNGKKYAAKDQPEDKNEKGLDEIIEVHSKALDDLVNVNSLFTMAVFIGLSFASPKQRSLEENRPQCDPDPVMAKRLIMFEVLSFGFFLVSSLAAKSLKVLLNFYKIKEKLTLNKRLKIFLSKTWRYTLLFVSFAASVAGIISLTLSIINLIQIRLGKMYCGSVYSTRSVSSLVAMVGISLVALYLPPFLMGMSADTKHQDEDKTDKNGSENSV